MAAALTAAGLEAFKQVSTGLQCSFCQMWAYSPPATLTTAAIRSPTAWMISSPPLSCRYASVCDVHRSLVCGVQKRRAPWEAAKASLHHRRWQTRGGVLRNLYGPGPPHPSLLSWMAVFSRPKYALKSFLLLFT